MLVSKFYFVLFARGSKICGSFGLVTGSTTAKLTDKMGNQNDKYGWDYKPLIVSCNSQEKVTPR